MIVKDVRQLNTANWQHKVGTIGEVVTELEDIGQCIDVICTTQKGSVPHNPNLGTDAFEYQDEPIGQAEPKIRKVLLFDIMTQEPRARIKSIDFDYSGNENGHLVAIINYQGKSSEQSSKRDITLWKI